MDMGQGVNQFSEQRIAFDDPNGTHQTEMQQKPNASDEHFLNVADSTYNEMKRRITNPELIALRGQNPFVDIVPFPMKSLFIVATKDNDTRDVTLPDGCQMVRFSANAIDFFVGVNGQVTMPPVEDVSGNAPLYNPVDCWYYVKGLRNISIGLALESTGVSIQCHIQN